MYIFFIYYKYNIFKEEENAKLFQNELQLTALKVLTS